MMAPRLDIFAVCNEDNVVLAGLGAQLEASFNVLVCYGRQMLVKCYRPRWPARDAKRSAGMTTT